MTWENGMGLQVTFNNKCDAARVNDEQNYTRSHPCAAAHWISMKQCSGCRISGRKRLFISSVLIAFAIHMPSLAASPDEAVVTICKDGSVLLDGTKVPLDKLSESLARKGFGPGSKVMLKSDSAASYQQTNAVLDALNKPERNLTFTVSEQDNQNAGSSPTPAPKAEPWPSGVLAITNETKSLGDKTLYVLDGTETPVFHLRNDTGLPVVFLAAAGESSSGKAVIHGDYVLVDAPKKGEPATLISWRERELVFPNEKPLQAFTYMARPGEEVDLVVGMTALSDLKNPKSARRPLSKGTYRVFLDVFTVEDVKSAPQKGIPPVPLVYCQFEIK
jgi:hypothetical protein